MKHGGILGLLIILGLTAVLLTYRLAEWPAIWFDEGRRLQIAENLAESGRFGVESVEGFRWFDPVSSTGPTVTVPIAAVFALTRVGLEQARVVAVLYGLAAMLCFYLLALKLFDAPTAIAASLLLLVMPGATQDTSGSFLALGRMVMGELPALMFLMLGALCLFAAMDNRGWPLAVLAGVCFGLAVITKPQSVLIFGVLGLTWVVDRLWHRQTAWHLLWIPVIVGLLTASTWWLIPRMTAGAASIEQGTVWNQVGSHALIGLAYPQQMIKSARALLQESVVVLTLPGLAYGAYLALDRSRMGLKRFFVFAIGAVWLMWYLVGSIGWIRYALPALAVMSLFTAKLLADLSHNFALSRKLLQFRSAANPEVLTAARDLAVTLVLAIVVFATLQEWFKDQVSINDTVTRDVAAYLTETVPADAVIETAEQELVFLTDLKFHQPTLAVIDMAIRHAQLGEPYPPGFYDFEPYSPDYLVVGWMGRGSELYAEALASGKYELMRRMGGYQIYQRTAENGGKTGE